MTISIGLFVKKYSFAQNADDNISIGMLVKILFSTEYLMTISIGLFGNKILFRTECGWQY